MKYLTYLKNKNLSKATIKTYLLWAKKWDCFSQNKNVNKTLFIQYIKAINKFKKPNTTRLIYSATKQYLIFKKYKFILHPINIRLSTQVEISRNIVTKQQFNEWIKELNLKDFYQKRMWIILSLLFKTGVRAFELLNIKNQDILEDKIFLKGKGNKFRYIYLDSAFLQKIKNRYRFIIVAKNGRKITQKQLNLIIKNFSQKVGYYFTPHDLRRSFCTNLIKNGCNLKVVQKLMGHSNISITSRYICLTEEDIVNEYKKFVDL